MDKSLKLILESACLSTIRHVLTIIKSKDSDRNKLIAITHYCNESEKVIQKVIDKS